MNPYLRLAKIVILTLAGIITALASLFFCYYTIRLIYVNLTSADAAAHRSSGMYIGFVAFPLAVIIFGAISWLCFRGMRRSK